MRSHQQILDELTLLLRPAAGGLYLVSTGRAEQQALQRRLYAGASGDDEVERRWRDDLARLKDAKVIVLGVPSDVGAGYLRGANLGPQAIRARLLEDHPDWPARAAAAGIVDVGDVFVVPQLLHDDMLSEAQKLATRRALYPTVDPDQAARLPVSPLSIAEHALHRILELCPKAAPLILGGDHSVAWPAIAALVNARSNAAEPWGIVQSDAHTDLLRDRLGIKVCFGTWAYHAHELVGRGRLVQVGIRASLYDQSHWERTLGVRQFWAKECRSRPTETIDAIVSYLRAQGITSVYFSNDIDGTDSAHADATGTPEPNGLRPDFLVQLIRRLGRDVGLCGGDIVEVAPPVERHPGGAARTVGLAVRYLLETIAAILGRTP